MLRVLSHNTQNIDFDQKVIQQVADLFHYRSCYVIPIFLDESPKLLVLFDSKLIIIQATCVIPSHSLLSPLP